MSVSTWCVISKNNINNRFITDIDIISSDPLINMYIECSKTDDIYSSEFDSLIASYDELSVYLNIKKRQIENYRIYIESQGISYNFPDSMSGIIQTRDSTDFRNLNALTLAGITMQSHEGKLFVLRDEANVDHQLTATEMATIGMYSTQYISNTYKISWYLKSIIQSYQSIQEIINYDIPSNWELAKATLGI